MTTYSKEIKELLQDIEVSDSDYEKAVTRYESVSNFICDNYKEDKPEIFLQGSFKLGTPIKPLTEDGAYDIDIVCCLTAYSKMKSSQSGLKRYLGEGILRYARVNGMKEEPSDGKRCWTMNYVDEHNFHIDILPSVLDGSAENVIAFTDKRNPNYNSISDDWEISNPKDYYRWFSEASRHSAYKKEYAARAMMEIERVPDYKVKTPLQRVIQMFKRHAEVMFEMDIEHKPSSIIITTLAAKTYITLGNQIDDFEILLSVLAKNLPLYLDDLGGKKCVLNPVNQEENLSEKWMRDDMYFRCFINWQHKLEQDFALNSYKNREFSLNQLKQSLNRASRNINYENNINSLPYHKKPKWPMRIEKEVEIEARYIRNGWRPTRFVSGEEIRKGLDLQFEIRADHLRVYDIYWQVTNTGYEAESARQLRGDFYESQIVEGKRVRKESTSYSGEHFVEVYIVKDGICYGKSKPFCVKIH